MQDEERRLIARQLHDTAGQNLGALSMGLSIVLSNPGLDPSTRKAIEENIALAGCCVRELRAVSYQLHPPLLDELGLASALRAYAGRYSEATGIGLALDLPPQMPRLPHALEIALFRIVQEGLSNIHRHSGAETAILRLQYEDGRLRLTLTDRGRGFPESQSGTGIAAMRERVRQLNGCLTIASGETGTTILVDLPVCVSNHAQ